VESDIVVGRDFRNRENQQLEIDVTGAARFVRQGGATPRARGRLSAAVGRTQRTTRRSPAVTATRSRDYRNRGGKAIAPVTALRVIGASPLQSSDAAPARNQSRRARRRTPAHAGARCWANSIANATQILDRTARALS
jgi:hypothetical protein